MFKLKKIQSDASWGKVVDDINGNNGAIVTAVEMSKFANVDWGDEVAFPIVNAISSSATLQHNTCYLFGEVEELNITLDSDDTPLVKVYMFQFHSGATPTRLSVPSSVEWANDPIIRANRVYQVTIIDGYATYREFLFNTAEIPTTEIWYTSLDGNVVEPYRTTGFGANYVSNDYESGKGIMTFASEVTKIAPNAFDGNTQLTSVTPPSSVKAIENYAFRNCTNLGKIHIPNGVTNIGVYAFSNTAITSISIPDSVTTMGTHICYKCTSLKEIVFSNALTAIGNYTCYDCDALESVVIPDSVTSIGNSAFRTCSNLTSVVLSDNLTTIDAYAFQSCKLTDIELPLGLITINNNAFQNCTFTRINIPSSVTTIGSDAFQVYYNKRVDITDLSAWCRINFADSLANPAAYGAALYLNDEEITDIVIPPDITEIKAYAFYGSSASLKSVTITANVTAIGNQAFYNRKGLTSVTFESTTPPTLGTDVFTNTHASLQLRVPMSSVDTYKAAYPAYASKIIGY